MNPFPLVTPIQSMTSFWSKTSATGRAFSMWSLTQSTLSGTLPPFTWISITWAFFWRSPLIKLSYTEKKGGSLKLSNLLFHPRVRTRETIKKPLTWTPEMSLLYWDSQRCLDELSRAEKPNGHLDWSQLEVDEVSTTPNVSISPECGRWLAPPCSTS